MFIHDKTARLLLCPLIRETKRIVGRPSSFLLLRAELWATARAFASWAAEGLAC